jgi:hypothetical protein
VGNPLDETELTAAIRSAIADRAWSAVEALAELKAARADSVPEIFADESRVIDLKDARRRLK